MKLNKVVVIFCSLFSVYECLPFGGYSRWFDYDDSPVGSLLGDNKKTPSARVVESVSPLRPYEPWVIDCLVFASHDEAKRHEECKEIDDKNENDYAIFLLHVSQWEEAFPERAARWNSRFPDAKAKEKKKYEDLKALSDSHKKIDATSTTKKPGTSPTTQRTKCPPTCEPTSKPNANNGGKKIPRAAYVYW